MQGPFVSSLSVLTDPRTMAFNVVATATLKPENPPPPGTSPSPRFPARWTTSSPLSTSPAQHGRRHPVRGLATGCCKPPVGSLAPRGPATRRPVPPCRRYTTRPPDVQGRGKRQAREEFVATDYGDPEHGDIARLAMLPGSLARSANLAHVWHIGTGLAQDVAALWRTVRDWDRSGKGEAPHDGGDMRGFAVARGGVEPPTFRFSVGRSYQLSYLAGRFRRTGNRYRSDPDGTRTRDLRRDRAAR